MKLSFQNFLTEMFKCHMDELVPESAAKLLD